MTKKAKQEVEKADMEVGPKITRTQYLDWRCYIYQIDIEKLKLSEKEHQINLLTKDVEIFALKRALVTKEQSSQADALNRAKQAYLKHREELGHEIGMNLDGAVIDPVTLEVKKIDQKESK